MPAKVAIITTHFLEPFAERVLEGFPQRGEFEIYYYSDFKSLIPIYEGLPKHITGIVASGSFPARMLELSFPDSDRLIRTFNNDNAGVYKLFLGLLDSDRTLSVDRIFADVIDVTGVKTPEFLFGQFDSNLSDLTHKSVSGWTLDELLTVEQDYARKHIRLWEEKRIDCSITRFSSIAKQLEEAGLKVRFAYPEISFVRNELLATLREMTIREMTENLTASIVVTVKGGNITDGMMKNLERALTKFGAAMNLNGHLQRKADSVEVLTNKEAVRVITDNFTSCKLRGFLNDSLRLETVIGYGIGFNLYQSRINAVDAGREAAIFGASGLINEEDELIVPLIEEKKLVVSRQHSVTVRQLSEISGLSRLTIQKIISVISALPNDQITSDELAYKLSITKRSANRFLSALNKSGLASVIDKTRGISRGRPEYIYRLMLNAAPTKEGVTE